MKCYTQAGSGVVRGQVNERGEFVTENEPSEAEYIRYLWVQQRTIYYWAEFGEEYNYPKIGGGVRGEYFVDC